MSSGKGVPAAENGGLEFRHQTRLHKASVQCKQGNLQL